MSDSAISTTINNEIFRVSEDGKKIWIIEDKIIFCSGNMNISYCLMDEYINSPIKSIQLLQQLAIELHNNEDMLEIIVGCIKDNKTIVYQISSYNDFEIIEKFVSGNDIGLWTGGIKTNECFDIAYGELKQDKNIFDTCQNTFDNISFEGIGGQLSVYKLDEYNINLIYKNNIVEKNIVRINFGDKHLVIADRLIGKILAGINLTIDSSVGSELHTFKVDSTGVSIKGSALTITPSNTSGTNGISLSPTSGLTIQQTNGTSTLTSQILLNATSGITIQKNIGSYSTPNWQSTFYVDNSGNLNLSGNIVSGSDILLNASTKTLDFSKFTVLTGKENVIKGIDVKNASNVSTFTVDTNGNVNISGNITMTGGTISWSSITAPSYTQVTGSKPPTNADNTSSILVGNGFTQIGSTYIYTGTLSANQITTGTLDASKVYGGYLQINSLYCSGTGSFGTIVAGTITGGLNGTLHSDYSYIDYLRGKTNYDLISLGSTGCYLDLTGGSARLKNSSGYYLSVEGNSLRLYSPGGSAITIASI